MDNMCTLSWFYYCKFYFGKLKYELCSCSAPYKSFSFKLSISQIFITKIILYIVYSTKEDHPQVATLSLHLTVHRINLMQIYISCIILRAYIKLMFYLWPHRKMYQSGSVDNSYHHNTLP